MRNRCAPTALQFAAVLQHPTSPLRRRSHHEGPLTCRAISRNVLGFKHELDEHIEDMQKELHPRDFPGGGGLGVTTLPRTSLHQHQLQMIQLASTMSMDEDEAEFQRACEGLPESHCVIDGSASVDDAVDALGRLRECLRDSGRAVLQVKDGGSSEALLDAVSLLHLLNQVCAESDGMRSVWHIHSMDDGFRKRKSALFCHCLLLAVDLTRLIPLTRPNCPPAGPAPRGGLQVLRLVPAIAGP